MAGEQKKKVAKKNSPKKIARKTYGGRASLLLTHPEIAAEALGWDAGNLTAGSQIEKMWICPLSHVYLAVISRRTKRGHGCPFCSGHQVWFGYNDLATTHPNISAEAVDGPVTGYSAGSQVILSWKCANHHVYEARIAKRVTGTNCPYCAKSGNKKIMPGFNDLATTHPEIASQAYKWDASRKSKGQRESVKWRCAEGHIWKAQIIKRVEGTGCPTCDNAGYDPNKSGFLYLLHHENWQLFKIGISNSQRSRTETHETRGWETLEILGPMDGLLAYEWEQSILIMLKKHGADLGRSDIAGKFDGYTESWVASSFPVTTIKGIMDLVQKDEDHF